MTRWKRILAVTGGLIATGAIVGAVCAVAASAVFLLATGDRAVLSQGPALAFIAGFGAVIGAVAAPVIAWGLLRRVPLGRAVGWSAVGTMLGALLGTLTTRIGPIYGAVAGLVVAAVSLWATHRTTADGSRTPR